MTWLRCRLHARIPFNSSATVSNASFKNSSLFPISKLFSFAIDSNSFESMPSSVAPNVLALDFNECALRRNDSISFVSSARYIFCIIFGASSRNASINSLMKPAPDICLSSSNVALSITGIKSPVANARGC